jgi:hypothetical protein
MVIESTPHLKLNSFIVSHPQSTHPSQASAGSFSVTNNLSIIIMKSLYFLQIFRSFVLIIGLWLSQHDTLTPYFVDLI